MDILLIILGIFCMGFQINENIKAYKGDIYNPLIFRLGESYEVSVKYSISAVAWILALSYIQQPINHLILFAISLVMYAVTRSILSLKSLVHGQKRRIILEIILMNAVLMLLIFNY